MHLGAQTERGHHPLVITNDIFTREDQQHVQRTLAGVLDSDRIRGVETGSCPHSAVREDPSLNLLAAEELVEIIQSDRVGGNKDRSRLGVMLQDDWKLVPGKLGLTYGARLDVDSRFGMAPSPRIAAT